MTYVDIQDVTGLLSSLKDAGELTPYQMIMLKQQVEQLPQHAHPDRKQGNWFAHRNDQWIYAKCSECGTVHDVASQFCPKCGVEMISTELFPEPTDIKFEGIINGLPAFSGATKLQFDSKRVLEQELPKSGGIAFIRGANLDGFFQYGIEQTAQDDMGHGPGYIWASRASVMNKVFDVALVDVLYKTDDSKFYGSCAIDVAHLREFLSNTAYMVDENGQASDEDLCYEIVKR